MAKKKTPGGTAGKGGVNPAPTRDNQTVRIAAEQLTIDPNIANSLYARYGKTMQAKALCGLLGTTPEALRSDANKILGGAQNGSQTPQKGKTGGSTKFPRLK